MDELGNSAASMIQVQVGQVQVGSSNETTGTAKAD
jgi:hypothetical protein